MVKIQSIYNGKKNRINWKFLYFLLMLYSSNLYSQNKNNEVFLNSAIPSYKKFNFPLEQIRSRINFYSFGLTYRYYIKITDKLKFGPSLSYNKTVMKALFDLRDKTNTISGEDQNSIGLGLNTKYCLFTNKNENSFEFGINYIHHLVQPVNFSLTGATIYSDNTILKSIVKETIIEKTSKDAISVFVNYVKHRKKINYFIGISPEFVLPNLYQVELITEYSTSSGTEIARSNLTNRELRINFIFGVHF